MKWSTGWLTFMPMPAALEPARRTLPCGGMQAATLPFAFPLPLPAALPLRTSATGCISAPASAASSGNQGVSRMSLFPRASSDLICETRHHAGLDLYGRL